MEANTKDRGQPTDVRPLSTLAARFVQETIRGSQSSRTTTLAQVREWLGDKADAALVLLTELEAAGHVQLLSPYSEWRLRVRARPVAMGEASGRFRLAVRIMASRTFAADQLHGPTWRSSTVYWRDQVAVRLTDGPDPAEWISIHRNRLMVMLTAAVDRGWHDLAFPFSEALGRTLFASNHFDDALRAVTIAHETWDRLEKPVIASLRSLLARTLGELDDHHQADYEATAALVCALQSGDAAAIVAAYTCRGWVRQHAGRPADALHDFEQAADLARAARMTDIATDQRTFAEAVVPTIERLEAAVSTIERAAGLLAWPSGSVEHGRMLNALSEALGYAHHSRSVHQRVARALTALLQASPPDKQAEIHVTQARNAEAIGQLTQAHSYYTQAMTAYAAAGLPEQAQVVQRTLDRLSQRNQPSDHSE